ncbi:hypothetical protein [Algimonas arctica]|uniref:hypothetical protein n=1 Tax=Algimonas arctica TaxID=1479486 RepID=UPI00167C1F9B|nr:hypothetical protein [Algimonas arctica]
MITISAAAGSDFYANLEDWDGEYKLYLGVENDGRSVTVNELVKGDWKRGVVLNTPAASATHGVYLSVSYYENGAYHIGLNGSSIVMPSTVSPSAIRQVGSEEASLDVSLQRRKAVSEPDAAEDDLANEMLA